MIIRKIKAIIIMLVVILFLAAVFLYGRNQVYYSHGSVEKSMIFEIKKGEGNAEVASNLEDSGLISWKIYFYYYLRTHNLTNKIMPGNFELNGKMTIPEIAKVITEGKKEFVKITFPEGWTMKQMAERLGENGYDKEEFLELAKNPDQDILGSFDFLSARPGKASLEGYLFPDTYYFSKDATTRGIIKKILDNFGRRVDEEMRAAAENGGHNLYQVVTMASILEGEVHRGDMKMVSGLFWGRITNEQPLQSCATIAFVLGEKKDQYSFDDTRVVSPYNTYLNKGLIPGPISNPGLDSITAAIYPTKSDYNYFLSDPKTGKTIFSKTIDEHNANKVKYGL